MELTSPDTSFIKKYLILTSPALLLLIAFSCFSIIDFHGINLYLLALVFFIQLTNIGLSAYLYLTLQTSKFIYFFNMLFIFGSFLKLALFKSIPMLLREPIGFYKLSNSDSKDLIIITGVASIAVTVSLLVISKFKNTNKTNTSTKYSTFLNSNVLIISCFVLSIVLTIINFKFNIIMFGFTPNIMLPFHGNAIFYLVLTRILPFFILFLSFNISSYRAIIYNALFFLIISFAVLSRMGIALYVFVLFFSFINFYKFNRLVFKKLMLIFISILIIIVSTVGLSSSARDHFYYSKGSFVNERQNAVQVILDIVNNSLSAKTIKTFFDLTVARWIGLEGIMAVEAYPNKGWILFYESLREPPYKGNAFYNKILQGNLLTVTSKAISTSVPGPVAFFYYTGSKTAVFTFLTIFLLFFSFLESILWKYYSDNFSAACFVIVFTVMDFHQFGIAPLSFFKYLLFTIVCLMVFYPLKKYFPRVTHEQN